MQNKTNSLYPILENEISETNTYARTSAVNNNDRRNLIMFMLDEKLRVLNNRLSHAQTTVKKFKKLHESLTIGAATSGSIAVGMTAASFTTAMTGIGLVVAVPLCGVSGILGLIGFTLSGVNQKVTSLLNKHKKQLKNVQDYKTKIERLILEAVHEDSEIDTLEYENILKTFNDFQRSEAKGADINVEVDHPVRSRSTNTPSAPSIENLYVASSKKAAAT